MKTNEEMMALAKAQRRKVFHRQSIMMIRDLIRNQQMIPTEYYLHFSSSLLCVFVALRAKRDATFIWKQVPPITMQVAPSSNLPVLLEFIPRI